MEERGIKLIREILGDSTADFAEKLYFLIKDKNLDKTRLRNTLIIRDHDTLYATQKYTLTEIYQKLANNYDISTYNVRLILNNRSFNEL